jgi:hypothetical protein
MLKDAGMMTPRYDAFTTHNTLLRFKTSLFVLMPSRNIISKRLEIHKLHVFFVIRVAYTSCIGQILPHINNLIVRLNLFGSCYVLPPLTGCIVTSVVVTVSLKCK